MLQNHLLPSRKTGIFYPLSKSRLHAGIETVVGGILLRRQIPGFMASKTYAQHGLTEKIVGYVFSGERIPIRGRGISVNSTVGEGMVVKILINLVM